MGQPPPPSKTFEVPGGVVITLPGRFVEDSGSGRLVPIDDLLFCYGKRSWNIGGNQTIREAIAVATREAFPDAKAFRLQAAHYLQDAEWRGPARKDLEWQREEVDGLKLRIAELTEVRDRWVIELAEPEAPLFAVVFVTTRYRERSIKALRTVFNQTVDLR